MSGLKKRAIKISILLFFNLNKTLFAVPYRMVPSVEIVFVQVQVCSRTTGEK